MNQKVHIVFVFIITNLFCGLNVYAQELSYSERKAIAHEAIKELKEGTLVLRLKSKQTKLVALNDLLAKEGLSAKERNNIEKRIETTISERDAYNKSLVDAFEDKFTFAEVYYMYDTASIALKSGVREGIFLNNNLQLDPSIIIPEGAFFVAKTGTTNSTSTTGVEAVIIMDGQFNDLQRPFPYYVRVNSIERLFVRIFRPKKLVRKDSREIVKKLEEKLWRFWQNLPRERT